jgi:short subunit dehydrogenase-like uncharacterized protein
MPFTKHSRQYDVVVFGATGRAGVMNPFPLTEAERNPYEPAPSVWALVQRLIDFSGYTGLRTAEFISEHFPTDTKWAVAGRSAQKLEDVVKTCQNLNPNRNAPRVEVCGLDDAELAALAKKTFILIAAIGPYHKYGEHAFKACAEAGTHYLDCTGEAVWHSAMIKKYHETAKASGACSE